MLTLATAFNIQRGDRVAFVGAGGKTSLLVALATELHALGWRVFASTTTRIGADELAGLPHAQLDVAQPQALTAAFDHHAFLFVYSDIRAGKGYGFAPEKLAALTAAVAPDVVLIEADGARKKWLKAPFAHEPVIPDNTTLVIPVASFLSIGQPLDETHVYNPHAIAQKVGATIGDVIQPEWIATLLSDTDFGLKNVPPFARVVAFLNAVPQPIPAAAHEIARLALASGRLERVVLGNTRLEPVVSIT